MADTKQYDKLKGLKKASFTGLTAVAGLVAGYVAANPEVLNKNVPPEYAVAVPVILALAKFVSNWYKNRTTK